MTPGLIQQTVKMDYTTAPALFKIRKAARYIGLYGVRRTLVKVRARYHMNREFAELPRNHLRENSSASVGLIG